MASKREFVILGSVYKTAKSVKDRVRAIKERLSFGVHVTKGDEDFEFMLDLYKKYYPRKETRDIKESEIMDLTVLMNRQSKEYPNSSPTFFWVDIHGCIDNWNPTECTDARRTERSKAIDALRLVIKPQRDAAKKRFVKSIKGELPICPITGKLFDPRVNGQAHVHHAPPEFNAIVQGFSETTGIDIETIELRKVPSNGYELADKTIAMMFADYHEIHARLQVVSKEGHDIVTYRREVPV